MWYKYISTEKRLEILSLTILPNLNVRAFCAYEKQSCSNHHGRSLIKDPLYYVIKAKKCKGDGIATTTKKRSKTKNISALKNKSWIIQQVIVQIIPQFAVMFQLARQLREGDSKSTLVILHNFSSICPKRDDWQTGVQKCFVRKSHKVTMFPEPKTSGVGNLLESNYEDILPPFTALL